MMLNGEIKQDGVQEQKVKISFITHTRLSVAFTVSNVIVIEIIQRNH